MLDKRGTIEGMIGGVQPLYKNRSSIRTNAEEESREFNVEIRQEHM